MIFLIDIKSLMQVLFFISQRKHVYSVDTPKNSLSGMEDGWTVS